MGHDLDIMILAWLARQPSGFTTGVDMLNGTVSDLKALGRRGLVAAVPSRDDQEVSGYVITPEGTKYSQGD